MIHVVLVEPEIHLNTGSIVRTCLATNSQLHLIKPLGFDIEDNKIKRYSANHFQFLKPYVYENWTHFLKVNHPQKIFFLSRKGKKLYCDVDLKNQKDNLFLVFGKESLGLPDSIINLYQDKLLRLPMSKKTRSLNLSNVVMTVVYEAKKQDRFFDLELKDSFS